MPHASSPSRPLLEQIRLVLGCLAPAESLRESLAKERTHLGHITADVNATAARLDDPARAAVTPYLETVHSAVTGYRAALHLVEKAVERQDVDTLIRASRRVQEGQEILDRVMLDLRNAALLAVGPTDIPDLNLLHRLVARVRTGERGHQEMLKVIERFLGNTDAAAQALDAEGDGSIEAHCLRDAYQRHRQALSALRMSVEEDRDDRAGQALEALLESFSDIRRLLPEVGLGLLTQGPTPSPQANAVINLARRRAGGRSGNDALRGALESLDEHLATVRERLQAPGEPLDGPALEGRLRQARSALSDAQESLAIIRSFFRHGHVRVLTEGADRLAEAVQVLHACHAVFQEHAERENKTPCFHCQHYNPPARRACEVCGGVLATRADAPRGASVAGDLPTDDPSTPLYENIATLLEAASGVAEGRVGPEQFAAVVHWFEDLVESQAAHAEQPLSPGVETVALVEAREHLVEAIGMLRNGLAAFRRAVDGQADVRLLQEGARQVLQANRHIHAIHESAGQGGQGQPGEAWA